MDQVRDDHDEAGQQSVVPDLTVDVIRRVDNADKEFERPSTAHAEWLYYLAENDREQGVGMDEIMRRFGMSVMAQGRVALSMQDAVQSGLADQVAPRGDQFRWRITEEGLQRLGLERVTVTPPPDPEQLAQFMRDLHGVSNVALLAEDIEEERQHRVAAGQAKYARPGEPGYRPEADRGLPSPD